MTHINMPPGTLGDVLRRAADPDGYQRWADQIRHTGYCTHPIRLCGQSLTVEEATGAITGVFDTDGEPDRMLLKACGSRRATVCRPCSQVYRVDSWHLVAAGLRGGKGIPASVERHPRLFVTLTAPSFGAVHSRREVAGQVQPCAPRRGRCPHGVHLRCGHRHHRDDPLLGQPLCPGCFDYTGAVLWNASVGELWRRTTIAVQRQLAQLAGLPVRQLAGVARLAFTRVAEYQTRGLVHVHAVLRLDAAPPPTHPEVCLPPPATFTAGLLADAVRAAVPRISAPAPMADTDTTGSVMWGPQLDVRAIPNTENTPEGANGVAGYVAKYATKSSDGEGALDHRLRTLDEIAELDVNDHLRRLVSTAWILGGRPHLAALRLRAWAHTLGFRGHWASRSRRYSTTLNALRIARQIWHRRHVAAPDTATVRVGQWRYLGRGHRNPGDAWLAGTAGRNARQARDLSRLDRHLPAAA
jgi:hypothetical protein